MFFSFYHLNHQHFFFTIIVISTPHHTVPFGNEQLDIWSYYIYTSKLYTLWVVVRICTTHNTASRACGKCRNDWQSRRALNKQKHITLSQRPTGCINNIDGFMLAESERTVSLLESCYTSLFARGESHPSTFHLFWRYFGVWWCSILKCSQIYIGRRLACVEVWDHGRVYSSILCCFLFVSFPHVCYMVNCKIWV